MTHSVLKTLHGLGLHLCASLARQDTNLEKIRKQLSTLALGWGGIQVSEVLSRKT